MSTNAACTSPPDYAVGDVGDPHVGLEGVDHPLHLSHVGIGEAKSEVKASSTRMV